MKRTTSFFFALILVASPSCKVDDDGLTSVADPGMGSGGASGAVEAHDSGAVPAGTGGLGTGGVTGAGGAKASGGTTGVGGTKATDGALGFGGLGGGLGSEAIDASGTGGMGGDAASGDAPGTGGGGGAGGIPSRDGAVDRPAGPGGDGPPAPKADARPDRPIDLRVVDAPAPSDDTNDLATVDAGSPMTLVWSDEFDGDANTGVEATKWSYITWDPGHVNDELQKYTSRLENVFQDGAGHLVIRGLDKPGAGNEYTSGRVQTNGHFTFQSGRVEVRAKLPAGIGSFPGIVAMGSTSSWPQCGELAIMEQYGQDKSWFYVSATAGGASGSGDTGNVKYTFPDATTASLDFHVYSLDWYDDHILFQVDGIEITRTTFATSSPFHTIPEYLILDLAIGGTMGGTIDPDAFPMEMIVDYVRVYAFD